MPPNLPARKAGGKRVAPTNPNNNKSLPIMHAQEIILEDGTKVNWERMIGAVLGPVLFQPRARSEETGERGSSGCFAVVARLALTVSP